MTHAAALLVENIDLLLKLPRQQGVLDLACGNGRNGLALSRHGVSVTFADRDKDKTSSIAEILQTESLPGSCWCVDLEKPDEDPLCGTCFDAAIVFNYLHRPRLVSLKSCIRSQGLVYYETFTKDNKQFGRPNSPDFLLNRNELKEIFGDWEVLHYFEGEMKNPTRAIASIIARKP